MDKFANTFLVFFILFFFNVASFGQARDAFAEANQLFVNKQYEQALTAYQKLLGETADAPTKAKLIYNVGLTYQKLKQYDKAVGTFKQIFTLQVNDLEVGGNIMQAYRNYRPSAQWEIGNSLFAKGDYEGALAAYRATREKYPFKSWCGTCQTSYEYKYALYEAVCLEYLGRYDEAVNQYLKIYDARLAEIYEANGQLDDLKSIIARRDAPLVADYQKKYAWTPEKIAESLPSTNLSEFIKIYELEKASNVTALMNLARRFANGGGDGRQDVVAKMLARHPRQTVPLIAGILRKDGYLPEFYYQILGRTGTPEAVAILKERAEKSISYRDATALVESLSFAGEPGENALKELGEKKLSENMEFVLRKYRSGEPLDETREKVKFPPLPKTKLPVEL